MRTTSLLGLILLPTVIGCGSADGAERLGTSSSAIQNGKLDTKAANNFAVGIASRQGAVCSGTLIAPNLVLTARHCVVPVDGSESAGVTCADTFPTKNASPSSLFVTTSPKFSTAKKFYEAALITTPKERGFCGNDIALITLEESIPASEAQPAIPVVQFSMTDRSKIGDKITALGYGITSPSANDSGVRRIHEGIGIECVPGDDSYSCKGLYRSDSDKEFITEGYVCSGDSGSGAFEQASFDSGKPYVLGALSRGPQTEEKCLAAIYSRTDAHADLIIETAINAAEKGGYDAPSWTSAEVDPASLDPEITGDCEGETCTDTDGTDPASDGAGDGTGATGSKSTSGCSTAPGRAGRRAESVGELFGLVALIGAVLASRRRRAS